MWLRVAEMDHIPYLPSMTQPSTFFIQPFLGQAYCQPLQIFVFFWEMQRENGEAVSEVHEPLTKKRCLAWWQ